MGLRILETENIEGGTDMARKNVSWKIKGMNRDTSVSGFSSDFAFENHNLRLSTNEGNTMTSLVNERGTKKLKLRVPIDTDVDKLSEDDYDEYLAGTPIGTAVINHRLIVFTTFNSSEYHIDYIYAIEKSKKDNIDFEGKILYTGNLNFDTDHPIETLTSYESENIQKVYWVDGKNQPRMINVAPYMDNKKYDDTSFDFVQELQLKEEVKVTKIFGAGQFPAGVIQYAFTYYNKYRQESNIFYTTPLQYISYVDRGGSAESVIANSFKIEISGIDTRFEYLRIYSILRTSVDATPYTKRIQDIKIDGAANIIFTDDGLQGDTVDPTELLYKGGEEISAETIEQKDGTLFLGNIKINRPHILDIRAALLDYSGIEKDQKLYLANDKIRSCRYKRYFMEASKDPLKYINTLSVKSADKKNYEYMGAAGFKSREYYRLGVQFQYKTGKWSEPCWIGDKQQLCVPEVLPNESAINIPEFRYKIDEASIGSNFFSYLYNLGYRKIRPIFAIPNFSNRTVLCQGVGCPTVYRPHERNASKVYAQSSWLFRTQIDNSLQDYTAEQNGGYVTCGVAGTKLVSQFSTPTKPSTPYSGKKLDAVSPYLRSTEIMGVYDDEHSFYCDSNIVTVHSPEFIFDTSFVAMDYKNCKMRAVGGVTIDRTFGDIDIQTETPAIGSNSAGFIHRSIVTNGNAALISGLFYNDYIVDDSNDADPKYRKYPASEYPVDFPVYMWQKNGSLNNDVNRSNRSAELIKKRISNYRLGKTTTYYFNKGKSQDDDTYTSDDSDFYDFIKYPEMGTSEENINERLNLDLVSFNFPTRDSETPSFVSEYKDVKDMQLFSNDDLSIIKINGNIYMGNIETMLTPTEASPFYFVGSPWRKTLDGENSTDFGSKCYFKLSLKDMNTEDSKNGVWELKYDTDSKATDPTKKYKWDWVQSNKNYENIGDRTKGLVNWREPISMKYKSTAHMVIQLDNSGAPDDLFKNDTLSYLPLVEIYKKYDKDTLYGGASDDAMRALNWIPCGPSVSFNAETNKLLLEFKWGDTYVQRFECLKTYPFTSEDKNQVIEIASFVCETRINIDGRYDRNRAQTTNLNMTPQNFNLLNQVYSQMDNFFTYKVTDNISYLNIDFPNNITWTKTKQNGADVDLWTNITVANVLELDGDKGEITKLARLNNQLIAFQDRGISQILYNESAQISTTEGVPLELANSGKVQGKRYYSDTVGCSNKWSMVQTPSGIYFMDSFDKSIYRFTGELSNISTTGGFNSWAKQNIPAPNVKWDPVKFDNYIAHYDKLNQDILFVNKNTALAFSEKLGCFTSFYDYGKASFLDNIEDTEIWIREDGYLWEHQAGEYCKFFGYNKPFSMTLIANPESQTDKIFTNLEFRASVEGDGTAEGNKFVPELPVDEIETWDEYQHGILILSNRNKGEKVTHGSSEGILNRKYRIWRCDIPRDNAPLDTKAEEAMGIKRTSRNPLDRMRNTWIYLKLKKKEKSKEDECLRKTEIHDIMVSYYN